MLPSCIKILFNAQDTTVSLQLLSYRFRQRHRWTFWHLQFRVRPWVLRGNSFIILLLHLTKVASLPPLVNELFSVTCADITRSLLVLENNIFYLPSEYNYRLHFKPRIHRPVVMVVVIQLIVEECSILALCYLPSVGFFLYASVLVLTVLQFSWLSYYL